MTLFSRLHKASMRSGSVRAMLTALQDAITRTAVGAARTSIRLGSITGQIQRTAPIFVKQRRWGAVLLGWNADGAR